jgi:hypothetical protein
MKILIVLLYSAISFAQVGKVSVLPADMELANCIPEVKLLSSKKAYQDKLKDLGFDARNLLRFPVISKEHMHDILSAVEYFPKWMNIGKNTDWDRIRIIFRPDMDIVANAFITLGMKWTEFESLHRQAIIIHEISHRLGTRFNNYAYSKYWEEIENSWDQVRFIPRVGWRADPNPEQTFVSKYAATNPSEDWAESLTSYRINPELLYSSSKVKYDFIKDNIYLGVEYFDRSSCELNPVPNNKESELIDFLDENYRSFKKNILKNDSFIEVAMKTLKEIESQSEEIYQRSNYTFKLYLESLKDTKAFEDTRAYRKYLRRTN